MTLPMRIAIVVFTLVSIAHLCRLVFQVEVLFNTWELPMWVSGVGFVVPGSLAFALRRQGRKKDA